MSQLRTLDLPADRMDGEVVAAFFFQDQRPLRGPAALLDWRLNGQLTDLLLDRGAQGRAGENVLVANNGKLVADWILFVGGGNWQGLGAETYRGLVRHLLATCRQAGFRRVALCLDVLQETESSFLEQMVEEVLGELSTAEEADLKCLLSLGEETARPGATRH